MYNCTLCCKGLRWGLSLNDEVTMRLHFVCACFAFSIFAVLRIAQGCYDPIRAAVCAVIAASIGFLVLKLRRT